MAIDQNPVAIDSIYGVWYYDSDLQDGTFLLNKNADHPYGQQFEFKKTGEFIDEYKAPCGNDLQLHHWQGSWMWNKKTGILSLQVKIRYNAEYKSFYNSLQEESREYWKLDRSIFIKPYANPERDLQQHELYQELYIDEISRETLILKLLPNIRIPD